MKATLRGMVFISAAVQVLEIRADSVLLNIEGAGQKWMRLGDVVDITLELEAEGKTKAKDEARRE